MSMLNIYTCAESTHFVQPRHIAACCDVDHSVIEGMLRQSLQGAVALKAESVAAINSSHTAVLQADVTGITILAAPSNMPQCVLESFM